MMILLNTKIDIDNNYTFHVTKNLNLIYGNLNQKTSNLPHFGAGGYYGKQTIFTLI